MGAKGLTSLPAVVPHASGGCGGVAKTLWAVAYFGTLSGAVWTAALARAAETSGAQAAPLQRVTGQSHRTATIHWAGVSLRDALARLPQLFDEPVFVDRRVDPSRRVTLDIEAGSVDDVLAPIASALLLGTSRLGPLRYLGPQATAEQLRTVAAVRSEEAAKLPAAKRAGLTRRQRVSWPRLTEPRGLITALAEERGWRIGHAERIPHDLWQAGGLPQLTLVEQLTVLLAGFDLTFRVAPSGRVLEIVVLEPTTIKRRYRLPPQFADAAGPLQQQLPDFAGRVERQGETIAVDGRLEDHERLVEILRGAPTAQRRPPPVRETKQLYTLRVEEQPVGAVLRQLAERLQWQLDIDEAAIRESGISLDERVSFAVENSGQDELLEAVLSPVGLDYRREGDTLRIVPDDSGK